MKLNIILYLLTQHKSFHFQNYQVSLNFFFHNMNTHKTLAQLIKNLSKSSEQPQKINHHDPNKIDLESLRQIATKNFKANWKVTTNISQMPEVKRLPGRHLGNWEISRMQLSKRSYKYPKDYKGIKIPSVGREFSKYVDRTLEGNIPYLYESQIGKIEGLRRRLTNKQQFHTINTVKNKQFGFPKYNYKSNPNHFNRDKFISHGN